MNGPQLLIKLNSKDTNFPQRVCLLNPQLAQVNLVTTNSNMIAQIQMKIETQIQIYRNEHACLTRTLLKSTSKQPTNTNTNVTTNTNLYFCKYK